MKKIVLINGTISGVLLVIILWISLALASPEMDSESMKYGEIIGYASMIICLSLIYFGIKAHRDRALEGHIRFIKALQVGLLITLVASFFYVAGWMILSNILAPDFMEKYIEFTLETLHRNGASLEEIEKTTAEMEKYQRYYQNPLLKAAITFMEIFPVGLIISVLSALILKNK